MRRVRLKYQENTLEGTDIAKRIKIRGAKHGDLRDEVCEWFSCA